MSPNKNNILFNTKIKMDKCIAYAKNLYKEGKIQDLKIELDSDYLPKIQFSLFSKKPDEYPIFPFEFIVRCSNYRLCAYTQPLTKEQEQKYVEHLGSEFVQRDLSSRCCVYYQNKWAMVDFDAFRDLVNFLIEPSTNIKLPRHLRNLTKTQF